MKIFAALAATLAASAALSACSPDDLRAAGDDPLQDAREAKGYEDDRQPPTPAPPTTPPSLEPPDSVGSPEPVKIPTN